ncbi:hypothetical protein N836_33845 [Leptolyngbya sp. Heron Island J]|uniref:hypothetical protein n=1 Tax=Leptolyngbya sp. Heron Island J TaxID=1385935 RepID=UPI0003B97EAD|nr:hypothetical protein [Leptolyngbya sp. Heron Island J]ESA38063.1 hypothetical protein N836_33845 [Leptolyngbya sp. Heron Island J]
MNFDTKQTIGQLLLSMGALGIVLAPILGGSAAAMLTTEQHRVASADNKDALNRKQESPESGEFARYESAQFSVDYPKEWQITPQGENGLAIVSLADGVNMPIRTDIVVLREDPQTVVPQRLDQLVAEAVAVQHYSLVAIDGQSGFRIWYEPEQGQRALITFVGYGNLQTVVISSQYAQEAEAEALVTQIHQSFVNHSVTQATTPTTP